MIAVVKDLDKDGVKLKELVKITRTVCDGIIILSLTQGKKTNSIKRVVLLLISHLKLSYLFDARLKNTLFTFFLQC